MEVWHFWAIAALVLFIVEIFTSGFAAVCLSIGAIAAAVASAAGSGAQGQIIWFAVFTLFSFVVVRPIMLKLFFKNKKKEEVKSGVDALIGREATVSETIDAASGSGRVSVDGDDWKAVARDESMVIPKGEKVIILKIDSIILTVDKK